MGGVGSRCVHSQAVWTSAIAQGSAADVGGAVGAGLCTTLCPGARPASGQHGPSSPLLQGWEGQSTHLLGHGNYFLFLFFFFATLQKRKMLKVLT